MPLKLSRSKFNIKFQKKIKCQSVLELQDPMPVPKLRKTKPNLGLKAAMLLLLLWIAPIKYWKRPGKNLSCQLQLLLCYDQWRHQPHNIPLSNSEHQEASFSTGIHQRRGLDIKLNPNNEPNPTYFFHMWVMSQLLG